MDIIGVNETAATPYYSGMYAGKPLSWLRDTSAVNVETSFGAIYRDVIILDPLNRKIDSYNLSTYSLTDAANRLVMKNKLIAAATPADSDHDGLPDYWETWAYGSLSRNAATTGTNGLKTLQHWAHCSPAPATGLIPGLPSMAVYPFDGSLSVFFTRRRGTAFGLMVTPEFSSTLSSWTTTGHGYEEWSVRTLYDGSGGELVEWHALAAVPFPYVRGRATLP